ncbi:putative CAMK family protein kinase [Tritrichomonas foetus]|uniref:CAMK family protein kinase n=1 Tax=Tritrichomonas foetus TaxID=1144522 RepID=A0A1J4J3M1_9EUKA|nr:putative CAMK family protein kinase [Tritrichomonas foetus]|eukprot:OHS94056.1 putative CAMK family protein kinase [Tritrichomonas foetus]
MKVKRGIYTMPPFSEEAQSLISRLLTLDPTKRITISEIKQHPFFRESIPNDYITPTPIPFPNLIQPIDPSTVTPEIVDILRKIGYNDDAELAVDLASPLHTMAKVFYYMLTTRLSFDQLDWSIAIDLSIGSQHENPMNDSTSPEIMMDPAHTAFGLSGSDPFHRHANSDHSSTSFDNINSIANTVDWNVPETSPMKCEQTFQATLNGIEITQLMRLMQILVTQFKMKWFFPDDFTMICRSDVVGGYIIIQSQCLNSEIDVLLTMQLFDGNTEVFAGVCKAVEEMFQGNTSF